MLSYDPKGHVISYRSSVATGRTKIFIARTSFRSEKLNSGIED